MLIGVGSGFDFGYILIEVLLYGEEINSFEFVIWYDDVICIWFMSNEVWVIEVVFWRNNGGFEDVVFWKKMDFFIELVID